MWEILSLLLAVALVVVSVLWRRAVSIQAGERARRTRERRALESELEASSVSSERQQRALLESMLDSVLLVDGADRIVFYNRAFHSLMGLRFDCIGMTLLEALRLPDVDNVVARVRRDKEVSGYPLELSGIDSRSIEINGSLIPSGAETSSPEVILVFRDLTRTKIYEKQKQEFVANVSHELRTPLSMITGYVETLINGAKNDEATLDKFLAVVSKHADRLKFLIEDLLTLSALESGNASLEINTINLRSAVNRVCEELKDRALKKRMELVLDMDPKLTMDADPRRADQVFTNLIDNAIKYGSADTKIHVHAGMSERCGRAGKVISIHNLGSAMTKEAQKRVFERFYRVDSGRSRELGGTGLGLSIVKHIVQLHHGSVDVTSSEAEGTTFQVWFPDSKGQASSTSSDIAESSASGRE